ECRNSTNFSHLSNEPFTLKVGHIVPDVWSVKVLFIFLFIITSFITELTLIFFRHTTPNSYYGFHLLVKGAFYTMALRHSCPLWSAPVIEIHQITFLSPIPVSS